MMFNNKAYSPNSLNTMNFKTAADSVVTERNEAYVLSSSYRYEEVNEPYSNTEKSTNALLNTRNSASPGDSVMTERNEAYGFSLQSSSYGYEEINKTCSNTENLRGKMDPVYKPPNCSK